MSNFSLFSSSITICCVFVRPDVLSSRLGDGSSSLLLQTVFVSVCLFLSPSWYVRTNPPTRARSCSSMLLGAAEHHTGKKPNKKKKTSPFFVCLCGWSPARSRVAFSQVCCDLTGPLTAATVNIRLSCDSRCCPPGKLRKVNVCCCRCQHLN